MSRVFFCVFSLCVFFCVGCVADEGDFVDADDDADDDDEVIDCGAAVTAPPARFDSFYEKFLNGPLPIVGSARVRDDAFPAVCDVLTHMLARRPDAVVEMRAGGVRVGILAASEVTTDLPEHSDLNEAFPDVDWDTRARGLGATPERPLTSCAEENVLGLAGDIYVGENILVHEMAHTLWIMGIHFTANGAAADAALVGAYDAAVAGGWFADTYALTNEQEYWAEGAQSWFNTNLEADPADGVHNSIDTRDELRAADPALAALLAAVFEDDDYQPPPY